MKQCYCVSTVQASRSSGLAREQKLVIETSREEAEERNCSEVHLLHPEPPLMNNITYWEMAGGAEPCLSLGAASFGFDLQPFLCFLGHPGNFRELMALETVKPVGTPRGYFFSFLWCMGIKWNSGKNQKPNM